MADYTKENNDWLAAHRLSGAINGLYGSVKKLQDTPPGSADFSTIAGTPSDCTSLQSALDDKLTKGTSTAGQIDSHLAAASPHSGHEVTSAKGQANGYAALDSGGKVPSAQLPASSGGGGVVEDTEANRPTAGTAGRIFMPSDGYYIQVDTGAAWNTYVKGQKCTAPPVASGLTGVYTTAQDTLTDTKEGLELKRVGTGGAQNYQCMFVKALPSAPYALTVGVNIKTIYQAGYWGIGICLSDGNSGTPKMTGFYFMFRGTAFTNLNIQNTYWTNSTTVSTENNVAFNTWSGVDFPILWMRIRDDNTNRYYELSSCKDGMWQIFATKTRTDFLTPTHGGLFLASTGTLGSGVVGAKMRIFDWTLA
jgi:hypothetical protein